MTKNLKIVILLMTVAGLCFARSGLHFTEEDLSFGIADSVFSVSGIYYFSTDNPGKYSILYPFPEEEIMGDPYDIRVYDMHSQEEIRVKTLNKTRSIRFVVQADNDTPIFISYKQRLYSNMARYILMSTHSWKEALRRVEYKLELPDDIRITYFSIEPDMHIPLDTSVLYLWQKEDFMPNGDLLFEFESK